MTGPLIVNSRDMERQAARAGVGLAFVVEEVAKRLIERGYLVPLLQQWSAAFPGFFLCYPAQRQMAPALRAFINGLRAAVLRNSAEAIEPEISRLLPMPLST